jgi:hypothetical protein
MKTLGHVMKMRLPVYSWLEYLAFAATYASNVLSLTVITHKWLPLNSKFHGSHSRLLVIL